MVFVFHFLIYFLSMIICSCIHVAANGIISFLWLISIPLWASLVTQSVKNLPAMQETLIQSLGQEDLLEDRLPTPVFLGFPCGSAVKESAHNGVGLGSIPGWEDPLEKEMATHSSILAGRIPRIEEPGRLQSMGLQESDTTERPSTQHTMS